MRSGILPPSATNSSRSTPSTSATDNMQTSTSPKGASDDCVICGDPVLASKILDCGHYVCAGCLDQLRKPYCPVCRNSLSGPLVTFRTLTDATARENADIADELTTQLLISERMAADPSFNPNVNYGRDPHEIVAFRGRHRIPPNLPRNPGRAPVNIRGPVPRAAVATSNSHIAQNQGSTGVTFIPNTRNLVAPTLTSVPQVSDRAPPSTSSSLSPETYNAIAQIDAVHARNSIGQRSSGLLLPEFLIRSRGFRASSPPRAVRASSPPRGVRASSPTRSSLPPSPILSASAFQIFEVPSVTSTAPPLPDLHSSTSNDSASPEPIIPWVQSNRNVIAQAPGRTRMYTAALGSSRSILPPSSPPRIISSPSQSVLRTILPPSSPPQSVLRTILPPSSPPQSVLRTILPPSSPPRNIPPPSSPPRNILP